jgi:hypothetical protein
MNVDGGLQIIAADARPVTEMIRLLRLRSPTAGVSRRAQRLRTRMGVANITSIASTLQSKLTTRLFGLPR